MVQEMHPGIGMLIDLTAAAGLLLCIGNCHRGPAADAVYLMYQVHSWLVAGKSQQSEAQAVEYLQWGRKWTKGRLAGWSKLCLILQLLLGDSSLQAEAQGHTTGTKVRCQFSSAGDQLT